MVLPAGTVQAGLAAIDSEGDEVRQTYESVVPEPAPLSHPEARRNSFTTITSADSTSFEEIVAVNEAMTMAVVLGDVSASMIVDDKMSSLRR